MENTDRIRRAIDATRGVIPGYFEKTLAQRAGLSESAAGSIYAAVDEAKLEQMLLDAEWVAYEHPSVQSGCSAFRADIPGSLGIVDLSTLPSNASVVLDDRKGTGKVSATIVGVRGESVDFTVLIVGLHEGAEVVFTFHPGDPVVPSVVQMSGAHGVAVPVRLALEMGLTTAKII